MIEVAFQSDTRDNTVDGFVTVMYKASYLSWAFVIGVRPFVLQSSFRR